MYRAPIAGFPCGGREPAAGRGSLWRGALASMQPTLLEGAGIAEVVGFEPTRGIGWAGNFAVPYLILSQAH
jgi:hypothetical protein